MNPALAEALALETLWPGRVRMRGRGLDLEMRLIGKGASARAYSPIDAPEDVYSVVFPENLDKDILEEARIFQPENPHIPAVEYVGLAEPDRLKVYKMPRYDVPVDPYKNGERAWYDARALWSCNNDDVDDTLTIGEQSQQMHACLASRPMGTPVSPALIEALDEISASAGRRSPHYAYDLHKENLAADRRGNLVLLDILMDTSP